MFPRFLLRLRFGVARFQAEYEKLLKLLPPGKAISRVNWWHKRNRFIYDLCMDPRLLDYVEDMKDDARCYFTGVPVGCIATGLGWQATVTTLEALRAIVHALRRNPPRGRGSGPLRGRPARCSTATGFPARRRGRRRRRPRPRRSPRAWDSRWR